MGAVKREAGLTAPVRGPADVVRFIRAALGPIYGSRAAVVVIGLDGASRVTGLAENRQRWTPRSLAVREMVDLAAELAAARRRARATGAEQARRTVDGRCPIVPHARPQVRARGSADPRLCGRVRRTLVVARPAAGRASRVQLTTATEFTVRIVSLSGTHGTVNPRAASRAHSAQIPTAGVILVA